MGCCWPDGEAGCEVNGFCAANDNGIGTNAETGYRVMERLDKNHIRVFVK